MLKCWDRSPVDPQSFDPTPGPPLPPTPANTVPPLVSAIGGLSVGEQLVVSGGTWSGGGSLARQWRRNGAPIWGATAISYILSYLDVGSSISATVTSTNAAGSVAAASNALGPIIEAAP